MMAGTPYETVDADGSGPRQVFGFRGGVWEIIGRVTLLVFPLLTLIFLFAVLGVNNSSGADGLPTSITNCTIDVSTLDVKFLRRSVNIFGSMFVIVTTIAVLYQSSIIVLRFLNVKLLMDFAKCFYTLDVIMAQMLTHWFAGGIVGSYLMTWFWGPYLGAVNEQLSSSANNAGNANLGLLWFLYCLFVASYVSYFIGQSRIVAKGAIRFYNKNN